MVECKNCRALTEDRIGNKGLTCYFGEDANDKDRECEYHFPNNPDNDAYLIARGLMTSGIIKPN